MLVAQQTTETNCLDILPQEVAADRNPQISLFLFLCRKQYLAAVLNVFSVSAFEPFREAPRYLPTKSKGRIYSSCVSRNSALRIQFTAFG